ncbi:MAG: glycosyltransferase family 4 protein [Roseivirga sp.]|nr:glycosyltransferase family 4 protein [Roseivirga sp.]
MSEKLHVLFLTPGFPKDEEDTACVTGIQAFLKALLKTRPHIRVTVIAMQYPREKKVYQWQGVKVHALGRPDYRSVTKFFTTNRPLSLIREIHVKNPIHILHSFWLGECTMIGQKVEKKLGIKHLCTIMGREMLGVNYYLKLIRLSKVRIVCQSAFQNSELMKRFQVPQAKVIPFGIEVTDLTPLKDQARSNDLLFVGNINENKNLEGFLEIASRLIQQFPELSILIIGDNFLETSVEGLLSKYGLKNNARYLGKVSNQVVLENMLHSKILVHTSFFEAGALVFMEALLQGMYIVSREVGLVQKQERWQVANTKEEFAEAISGHLHSDLRFERQIPYSIGQTVEDYTGLYQTLLSEASGAG